MTTGINLLDDPEYFLHRINFQTGRFEFLKIDRETISRSTFLDESAVSGCPKQPAIEMADIERQLEKAVKVPPPVDKFIFHIGFCCSTLIARALEHPGTVLSLREPNVLLNLADIKRWPSEDSKPPVSYDKALDISLRLLNKPFEENETVVVKPSNISNNLITDMMRKSPSARAVLLHIPLKSFLISILKKSEPGRAFCRRVFFKYGQDPDFRNSEFFKPSFFLTDLQVTIFLWIMQMQLFQKVLDTTPAEKILVLNAENFLDSPAVHLSQIAGFLGLSLDKAHFDNVVSGPLFQSDSKKQDQSFSLTQRSQENHQVYSQNAEVIEKMLEWSNPFLERAGISASFK